MTETFPNRVADVLGVDPVPVPTSLLDLAECVSVGLADHPASALVEHCLLDAWRHAMRRDGDEIFVVTGDIPAMWLRDSTAQVRPYLAVAAEDPLVADALAAVSRRQARCVRLDPYANAFNPGPTAARVHADQPEPEPWVWERKYEVDSLCAVLQLGYALWRATGRTDHLDAGFHAAARSIVATWRGEQDHASSPYAFERIGGEFASDTLARDGRGGPVAVTGMTWSGFRPSDDPCTFGYLVPANAAASASLHGLAAVATHVLGDPALAVEALALAEAIDTGIDTYGRHLDGTVLAYEVDGLGGVQTGDDANLPSLLSLPLSGWCEATDALYLATRNHVLSSANPWFYMGSHGSGIGSAHTPPGHVWPIAVAAAGLTAVDTSERDRALDLLASTTGGTGTMHESFHVDDPARHTRPWFGWGNAMFSELAMAAVGIDVARHFPRRGLTATPGT